MTGNGRASGEAGGQAPDGAESAAGPPDVRRAMARLLDAFGPQGWWPAESAEEVVIGAVLTQAVSWRNVERAIAALRREGLLSLSALAAAPHAQVAELVRPAGYFNAKATKLASVARFVTMAGGLASLHTRDTAELRATLLRVHGIGPETADAILCYALGRPSFVADAYARRIGGRVGWLRPGTGYEPARARFEDALAGEDLGECHALLVRLAKEHCSRRAPDCARCPLRADCRVARTGMLPLDGPVRPRASEGRAKGRTVPAFAGFPPDGHGPTPPGRQGEDPTWKA